MNEERLNFIKGLGFSSKNYNKINNYINNYIESDFKKSITMSNNSGIDFSPTQMILALRSLAKINNLDKINIINDTTDSNLLTWRYTHRLEEDIQFIPSLEMMINSRLIDGCVKTLNNLMKDYNIYLYLLFSEIEFMGKYINIIHRFYTK